MQARAGAGKGRGSLGHWQAGRQREGQANKSWGSEAGRQREESAALGGQAGRGIGRKEWKVRKAGRGRQRQTGAGRQGYLDIGRERQR